MLDYELFEKQATNSNKTYQFITSMQEIKLQDCEQRRRWEWEDVQADLFQVQMKNLKLQQTQEAGSIFINEVKNIVITIVAVTAVIHGEMTLGMMLAVQYIIGQLNSPIEQLMKFLYSLQDVKISLERINEIHEMKNEEKHGGRSTALGNNMGSLQFKGVDFKYDPHQPHKTIDNINLTIPEGKITAGYIPPVLVRSGITIITGILLILFLTTYFVPYPENIVGTATVHEMEPSICYIDILIPYKNVSQIEKNMPVKVELEGYDTKKFGLLDGEILMIDKQVIAIQNKNYFKAEASLVLSQYKPKVLNLMKGKAYILLSNKSILSSLLDSHDVEPTKH